ncbi:NUDIX hydrolase [Sphingobacterium sp. LRF_L2]|uniref:NUDIX hydrolase n=1 Tax=Sphingobacterium sp. LRF_L2 TaxID=3369421 RepID=UPI003F5EE604
MDIIRLASAMLLDKEKRLLVVKKKKSIYHIMPGGKIEQGERPEEALIRELGEELALTIPISDLTFLGTHETCAVNEKETYVQGHVFQVLFEGDPTTLAPQAEIESLLWLTKDNYTEYILANLLREFTIPHWLAL